MSVFPNFSRRAVGCLLVAALAAMFIVSIQNTFSGLSLVEAPAPQSAPEGRGNMPPSDSPPMETSGTGMGFALSEKQSDTVSQLMEKLRATPDNANLLMEIGDVFMTVEDWGRAQVFLKRAMVSAPSDTRPRAMTAVCLFRLGKVQEAAEVFEGLLDIKKEPQAMYNLGLLYKYHLKQPEKAIALFQQITASIDAEVEVIAKARQELEKK